MLHKLGSKACNNLRHDVDMEETIEAGVLVRAESSCVLSLSESTLSTVLTRVLKMCHNAGYAARQLQYWYVHDQCHGSVAQTLTGQKLHTTRTPHTS